MRMASPFLDTEAGHGLQQVRRLLLHAARGSRGLFDQGRVLLGALVDQVHRMVHLLDVIALLLRGGADLGHQIADPAHVGHDLVHGAAGTLDLGGTGPDVGHRLIDQLLDLLGCAVRTQRQLADLGGDHREAAAMFAGTRSLHRGIQCEDVGLESNAIDHGDDVPDAARRGFDTPHRLHYFPDHSTALPGHARGPTLANSLAWRACSAFWRTVEVSSSMDAAVSSKLAACCSVRRDKSPLPAAISVDAVLIAVDACWMRETISVS
ncbi:hypothetical protein G6F57_012766 [Rhizopus arrhizus]|nr:hypothetical protein G6F57_012766 [Rhizopus arrhizus]